MNKIKKIRSGGQTGVDRAALDTAKEKGMDICGWCPKDGWAEDCPDPPGVREKYPELCETPLKDVRQRTVWNVRDSDAVLIINSMEKSPGTSLTKRAAEALKKPFFEVNNKDDLKAAADWLSSFEKPIVLNVGGPRESECEGIYAQAREILPAILDAVNNA